MVTWGHGDSCTIHAYIDKRGYYAMLCHAMHTHARIDALVD